MSATLSAPAGQQTWQLDATHSTVNFAVRHMMFATVRGQFGEVAGTITLDGGDLRTAKVNVTIGIGTVDTRMPQRDQHLKSADFFDAETHPAATFVAAGATPNANGTWTLPGTLTLKGIAKPVSLTVTPLGEGKDPWGNARAAWSATTTIDRRDFGLGWNQALEAGGVLVGNEVELTLDLQAVRA